MKRTCIGSLILMALVGGAAGGAEADDAPLAVLATKVVTLDDLVTETLAQNPELKFYEAEILAAKGGRKTAGLIANPELSGSVGNKTVRGGGLSAEGVAWLVSVVQPFEWPGRLGLRKAIANRDVELAQQGFRVDLAKNERYPAIAIGPSYSLENAGDREQVIGVAVSLPLPLWNRNRGNIEAAKARQIQAEVSLNVTELEVQRQVITAALTYETKLREMAKWRSDSVPHFKQAAELADRHYRLGAVPISTYVELQQQYLEAVGSLLDTKREALDAAAQLELLTGVPLPLVSTSEQEEGR